MRDGDYIQPLGNGAAKPPPPGQLRHALQSLKAAANGWIDDSCGSMAASIAFYAAFSLAPMLVIVIALAGLFFGREAVQGQLFSQIDGLVGHDGAKVVQTMVANAWKGGHGGAKAAISAVVIAVGATATFAELHASLALIWNRRAAVKPADWRMSLGRLVRVRLMSVGLITGIGFLLLVLLVFDAASTAAYEWFLGHDSPLDYGLLALQRLASWAALSFIFAVLLRYLSDARPRWREVIPGAALGALLFTIGKRLFGLYLARAGTADAFGAAGSLAVVLMWLFYSAAVFLFGAQYAARSRLEQPALI